LAYDAMCQERRSAPQQKIHSITLLAWASIVDGKSMPRALAVSGQSQQTKFPSLYSITSLARRSVGGTKSGGHPDEISIEERVRQSVAGVLLTGDDHQRHAHLGVAQTAPESGH
jgi:hypothetical protein